LPSLRFDPITGYLPEGMHVVSLTAVRKYLVNDFSHSRTRGRLYEKFIRYISALRRRVRLIGAVVDGSYVTNKVDPNDIDLSVIVDGSAFENCSPKSQSMLAKFIINDSPDAGHFYDCHPFLCFFLYPDGHPLSSLNDISLVESARFWMLTKEDQPKGPKGILYIDLQ